MEGEKILEDVRKGKEPSDISGCFTQGEKWKLVYLIEIGLNFWRAITDEKRKAKEKYLATNSQIKGYSAPHVTH